MAGRFDLRDHGHASCCAGRLDVLEVFAGVRLIRIPVQPLHPRIVGPESEASVELHLLLVSVVGVVVEVVGKMKVEHVLLPVRLPGAELDDELWWIVMATAVELEMSLLGI